MTTVKSALTRKAAKAVVVHSAHGAVAKARRRPARTVTLLGTGAGLGLVLGVAIGRRTAPAPPPPVPAGRMPGTEAADATRPQAAEAETATPVDAAVAAASGTPFGAV